MIATLSVPLSLSPAASDTGMLLLVFLAGCALLGCALLITLWLVIRVVELVQRRRTLRQARREEELERVHRGPGEP